MTDVTRCRETIASYVLDAAEPVSYRTLPCFVGGSSATRHEALTQFLEENASGVQALHVTVQRGAVASKATKNATVDPRARVIRISASVADEKENAQVYGVFPASSDADGKDVVEAMTIALWAQERKVRNELFDKVEKTQPLSRELKAFYASDVQCPEATSRTDVGDTQGEEAVSAFDSVRTVTTTSRAKVQSPTASSKAPKPASSFFKSNGSSAKTASKPKATPVSKPVAAKPETKRVDSNAMNNVLTVDSDEDESDDGGAPAFVQKKPATAKPRVRRVISDDEDEDEEMEEPAPAKKTAQAKVPSPPRPAKRKLQSSPKKPTASKAKPADSPKRQRVASVDDQTEQEPPAEEDEAPTGPIKRRVAVTKTRINEQGYMVTEKTFEEVEVSAEELAKERAEAKKKQAAEQAAAAAAKARQASAAAKAAKSSGPAKQKKLDFFFTKK
ncbi:hypothetical protein Poli38472_003106 [Pythium oligandrum]|uniref:DNA polymerase delta subunit 3 n=1 Tax=Pythium oligandrum TaxID=41045 RepID=A0A8K1FCH0_PYTOL|nr:hypothetical protein Poli38472_003106 [Pythium oligandrum]|eukprot:TMW57181.1 hypothetical protein Poli38472_003106 [Pythium oligandrum]